MLSMIENKKRRDFVSAFLSACQKSPLWGFFDCASPPSILAEHKMLFSKSLGFQGFSSGGLLDSRTALCRCRWQIQAKRCFRSRAIGGPSRSRPGNGFAARRARGLAPSSSPAALSVDISARFFDSFRDGLKARFETVSFEMPGLIFPEPPASFPGGAGLPRSWAGYPRLW